MITIKALSDRVGISPLDTSGYPTGLKSVILRKGETIDIKVSALSDLGGKLSIELASLVRSGLIEVSAGAGDRILSAAELTITGVSGTQPSRSSSEVEFMMIPPDTTIDLSYTYPIKIIYAPQATSSRIRIPAPVVGEHFEIGFLDVASLETNIGAAIIVPVGVITPPITLVPGRITKIHAVSLMGEVSWLVWERTELSFGT